jgi:hypothetical protein
MREEDGHDDSQQLRSDYFFLEDVLQTVHRSKRLLRTLGAAPANTPNHHHHHEPNHINTVEGDSMTGSMSEPPHPLLLKTQPIDITEQLMAPIQFNAGGNQNHHNRYQPHHSSSNVPPKWRRLVQEAQERGIKLMLMPPSMQRHTTNTSFYSPKARMIHWKVEFRFHHGGGESVNNQNKVEVWTITKLSEKASLWDQWNHWKSQSHPTLLLQDHVHLLIKRLPCPQNRPRYIEIPPIEKRTTMSGDASLPNNNELNRQHNNNNKEPPADCLRTVLQGMTVIEHPTVEVVPHDQLDQFPLFIQPVASSSRTTSPPPASPERAGIVVKESRSDSVDDESNNMKSIAVSNMTTSLLF